MRDTCPRCSQIHTKCTAHRIDGQPCGMNPATGIDVCKRHGGAAAQVKAKAAERLAEQRARDLAVTLGVAVEIDPREAILQHIHWSWGHVLYFRARVQALDPEALIWGATGTRTGHGPEGPIDVTDESAAAHMWLRLYDAERDRHARLCLDAIKVGLDERRVRLEESKAELLIEGLRWMIGEARTRLDLTEAATAALTDIVQETLRRLDTLEPSR